MNVLVWHLEDGVSAFWFMIFLSKVNDFNHHRLVTETRLNNWDQHSNIFYDDSY